MTAHAWILLVVFGIVLLALAIPLGRYIAHVMEGRLRLAAGLESVLSRLCRIDAQARMSWLKYALAVVLFNGLGVQNFLSAATGIVVVIALIRGFASHSAQSIGNAWVDLSTRSPGWAPTASRSGTPRARR